MLPVVNMPPNQVPPPHHMQTMPPQVYMPGQMEGQMSHPAIPPHMDIHGGFQSPVNYGPGRSPLDDRDRDNERERGYERRDSYDEHTEMMDYRREKERLERRRQRDRERFENERRGRSYDKRNDNRDRDPDRVSDRRKRDSSNTPQRELHNSEVLVYIFHCLKHFLDIYSCIEINLHQVKDEI